MKACDVDILYVANMRVPTEKAHGYQIYQMCQAFIQSGASVKLLVPFRVNEKELRNIKNPEKYYNLEVLVPLIKIPAFDFIYITRPFLKLMPRVQFFGNLAHLVSFAFFLLFYLLILGRKKIIYIRDVNLFSILSLILSPLGFKFAVEIHSLPDNQKRFDRYVRILSRANLIVTMTAAMKGMIDGKMEERVKIIEAHDAVDIKNFDKECSKKEARSKLNLPLNQFIFTYVGKFHTIGMEKGIPEIIKSAKAILENFSDILFLFVGGPLSRVDYYTELIDQLDLARENFMFLDKQPVADVPFYLKASDVLLMPFPDKYHYRFCMSPLKLFEYMTSQRPIIATRLESVEEILKHGVNALLVAPDDISELSDAMGVLISDSKLAQRLGSDAYDFIKKWSWKDRAYKILSAVEMV